MIKVHYTSLCYAPELVLRRYVRAACTASDEYEWVEVDAYGYTIRDGTCVAADLPDEMAERANALKGRAFGYVDWPNMCE